MNIIIYNVIFKIMVSHKALLYAICSFKYSNNDRCYSNKWNRNWLVLMISVFDYKNRITFAYYQFTVSYCII